MSSTVSPSLRASRAISAHMLGPRLRVQAGGGLVQEQHARPVHQAHGHVELALHAAGPGAGQPVGRLGQAEPVQQLGRAGPRSRAAQPYMRPCRTQVLPAGGRRVEAGFWET